MMQQEFEQRIGHAVSADDYQKIEAVYAFYPSQQDLTKDKVAELYQIFGMRMFDDLLPRAQKSIELDEQIRQAQKALAEL